MRIGVYMAQRTVLWTFASLLLAGCLTAGCATALPTPVPLSGPSTASARSVAVTPDATAQEEAAGGAAVQPTVTLAVDAAPTRPTVAPRPTTSDSRKVATLAPTASATQVIPPTLQDEIFSVGLFGRGGGDACAGSTMEGRGMEWMPGWGSGTLCLFGFEVGETVAWEVYDAAGELVFSGSSEVEPASDGPTFLAVDLVTKTYSPGEWTIRAMAPSGEMNSSFLVGGRETAPYVELKVEESPDVIANGRDRNNLVEGDVLLIRAVYLPAAAPIAVGIYYIVGSDMDGEHLRLMNSAVFASSEEGRLEFSITIDRSDKPGTYALVVSSASDYAPSGMPDVKGATDTFGVAEP